MQRLRIFIDPRIKTLYGPEICWTWRLLLGGIGYTWEEVFEKSSECEVAYLVSFQDSPKCKICIKADPDRWARKSHWRLETLRSTDGLLHPVFNGEPYASLGFSMKEGCLICDRDIIFDIFWSVTGQEEKHWPKNKHGFFDLNGATFLREQALRLAPGSAIGRWLENKLSKLFSVPPVPRWPQGKKAAVCLSHDVDNPEISRLLEPIHLIWRQGLSGLRPAISILTGSKNYWNFSSWIQMEKEYDIQSAFYFSAQHGSLIKYLRGTPDPFYDVRSEQFKEVFHQLTEEGFEIGLHASYRAFESKERFESEKNLLQLVSGQEIRGNRHHFWHLNPDDVESTLFLHEKVGLKYDTSLTHERYIGWRRNLSWPFFPFLQKERRESKTLEISTTWMDDHLFGYLKWNPGDRMETLQSLADTTAGQGGCLLIDVHDYVFDETLFPGWRKSYQRLLEVLINHSDFWIAKPIEIAQHWIERYESIVRESTGLNEGLK